MAKIELKDLISEEEMVELRTTEAELASVNSKGLTKVQIESLKASQERLNNSMQKLETALASRSSIIISDKH